MQDLRLALRRLRSSPGHACAVILTLALGIGASTAVFSAISGILLRPLPYPSDEQLVRIVSISAESGGASGLLSYQDFVDLRDQTTALRYAAAYKWRGLTILDDAGAIHADGAMVTASFFDVLGLRPALGRFFRPDEDLFANQRVIVLSWELWQRRFGGDSTVVGRSYVFGEVPHTVIGVAPRRFASGRLPGIGAHDFWLPFGFDGRSADDTPIPDRGSRLLFAAARLAEGASLPQANAELHAVAARLEADYPNENAGITASAVSLRGYAAGDIRASLFLLFAAVGLLLSIAVANVGNLSLSRAADRAAEFAVRAAIGASRARVIRQLVIENMVLAAVGGTAGLLVAFFGTDLLVAALGATASSSARVAAGGIPLTDQIGPDWRVLGFTATITVLVGLVLGLYPAWRASRADLHSLLTTGPGRTSTVGKKWIRMQGALVVSQVALSVLLATAAGVVVKSFWQLTHVDLGMRTQNILTFRLRPDPNYGDGTAFYSQLADQVRAIPGVAAVASVDFLPMSGNSELRQVRALDRVPGVADGELYAERIRVDPGFHRVMQIPLLRGRPFTEADASERRRVAIINEALAERLWSGDNPIGRRIIIAENQQFQVVGLARNVKHASLEEPARPQFYMTFAVLPYSSRTVLVKMEGPPLRLLPQVRVAVSSVTDDTPIIDVMTADELVSRAVAAPRVRTVALGGFAGTALLLVVVGIYGVMSYSVSQRRQELAIRMALGARVWQLVELVVRRGMALVVVGLALGTALAVAASRTVSGLLFQVSATDPAVYLVVLLLLTSTALVACYLPARRGLRLEPSAALDSE